MTEYYFSLQAEGEDPIKHHIIAVQYQALDGTEPRGNFTVLAEWEWGEKETLLGALRRGFLGPEVTAVGFDVRRKLDYLAGRAEGRKLLVKDLEAVRARVATKPSVDLAEEMEARGLHRPEYGYLRGLSTEVGALYRRGNYRGIVEHLHRQRDIALELYRELRALRG